MGVVMCLVSFFFFTFVAGNLHLFRIFRYKLVRTFVYFPRSVLRQSKGAFFRERFLPKCVIVFTAVCFI